MSGPLLELRGVCAGYGAAPVLREVDLTIEAGEIVGLLGANGAGKSTTMRTIVGALGLQAGEIRFQGERLRAPVHRRARRGIAFIGEDRSLFPHLSVADNLRLGRGSVRAALEIFPELAPLSKRRAGVLSGGEQQMLSVSRALAGRPRLLLIDELSLGLAPMIVDRLLEAVVDLTEDEAGVLLVEQHARKALKVSSRAYVLCRGAVDMTDTGANLLDRFEEVQRAYLRSEAR